MPTTLINIFEDRVKKSADLIAFQYVKDNKLRTWTFAEYYRDCTYFAAALLELNIKERGCINVVGFNSPEWIISFIGREYM